MKSFLIFIFFIYYLISKVSLAGVNQCNDYKGLELTKIPPLDSSTVCKNRNQWIKKQMGISKPISELSRIKEKDLFLLGEAHFTESCKMYGSIIDNLKNQNGSTCLFLEFNEWLFSEVIVKADEQSPVKCFRDLVEKAKTDGIKVFPVDKEGVEHNREYFLTTLGLNERDEYMAGQIVSKKPECDRSIMIVGKEHVSSMKPGRYNLLERIKKTYNVDAINLQNTRGLLPPFEGERDLSWTYNGLCTPIKLSPDGIRFFENEGAPSYMDILPGEGHWSDFNKTILL